MLEVKSIECIDIFYEVIGEGEISLIFIGGLRHLLVWEDPMTFNKTLVETINELRKK